MGSGGWRVGYDVFFLPYHSSPSSRPEFGVLPQIVGMKPKVFSRIRRITASSLWLKTERWVHIDVHLWLVVFKRQDTCLSFRNLS